MFSPELLRLCTPKEGWQLDPWCCSQLPWWLREQWPQHSFLALLVIGTCWGEGSGNHVGNCLQSWHWLKPHMTSRTPGLGELVSWLSSSWGWCLTSPFMSQHPFPTLLHSLWVCITLPLSQVGLMRQLTEPCSRMSVGPIDRNMQGGSVQTQTISPFQDDFWIQYPRGSLEDDVNFFSKDYCADFRWVV
jgi:hypothetical protein